ncbi:MAG TPA: glutamine--fructose-6-phosphate transaminase (isomerizing) [Candidatus Avisuccinivibrio pullicola]|nr:glutamine--fructose-6-phosphate transaminase (isomerizing) [Candidatus Avisuccinivibrio pullicola]
MCGIVGANAKRDILEILLTGLHALEYRGYDSAGISILHNGALKTVKTAGKVAALEEKLAALGDNALSGSMGIAHTRWATHGVPSEVNAHPHVAGTIALVHNGIVENYRALKEKLTTEGYSFESETDTEVLVKLIHSKRKQSADLKEAVRAALLEAHGSFAIAVLDSEEPDVLICAREKSPLVVGLGIGENFIASDVLALLPVTSRFIYLDDGEMATVYRERVEIFKVSDGSRVEKSSQLCTEGPEAISKGQYRHYMQKEIFEQPEALLNTALGRLTADSVEDETFRGYRPELLEGIEHIQIVACGTSYHAGLVGRYYLEELAGIYTSVEIASEYRYRHPVVPKNSLFISISQSGETADTRAALTLAKSLGFKSTLAICNVANSSLVRESDMVLLTRAGSEIGVASTKAFTTQLLALLLITLRLGRDNGHISAGRGAKLVEAIRSLPSLTENALKSDPEILKIAPEFAGKEHTLFLGRGPMFPIALEGALKLKEISYIHAEGYASGELKHGPIALIDADMPVVVVAPDNEHLSKLLSNVEEVRARGGMLYIFASEGVVIPPSPSTRVITIQSGDPLLDPLLFTVALQLLAYHVAVINGTDVDQPRNLAKSVTVE